MAGSEKLSLTAMFTNVIVKAAVLDNFFREVRWKQSRRVMKTWWTRVESKNLSFRMDTSFTKVDRSHKLRPKGVR